MAKKISRSALWPLWCKKGQIKIQEASSKVKNGGCTADKKVYVRQKRSRGYRRTRLIFKSTQNYVVLKVLNKILGASELTEA